MNLKIYILIPTRNRYDTLKYTVQNCLNQQYENLEIIVSDNFSSDDTPKIQTDFNDKRLKYQRSDRSLPMLYSWEFALSAVKEPGHVHFMGDDNGITVDGVQRVVNIIAETGASIILSSPIQYTWPNNIMKFGYLSIPKGEEVYQIKSVHALNAAYTLRIGFDRLPTINGAFVHTSVINKAKNFFDGRYFIASNPDVCSAIINCYIEDNYIYTEKPFMINGASIHSNGMQGGSQSKSSFGEDNIKGGYVYHPLFPPSKGYHLNVYEAFAQVSNFIIKKTGRSFYKLNYRNVFNRFLNKEYLSLNRFWLYDDIVEFAKRNHIDKKIPRLPEFDVHANNPAKNMVTVVKNGTDSVQFHAPSLPLNNVKEAAAFATEYLNKKSLLDFRYYKISIKEYIKRWVIYRAILKARKIHIGR